MNQILTDEEITLIVRECARGSSINRDGSTSQRIARAIESAILNKLNSAEPVRPDWYQNPTSEQWFESPDDAQILEDLDSITVGDVIELDVCWNGTQMFRVTKLADETSDDVEFELIESSKKLYLHPPAPSAVEGLTAIHLKTGNEYQVIGEAIDATNTHCNQLMVIYPRDGKTFVREAEEFQEKFKAAAARSKE